MLYVKFQRNYNNMTYIEQTILGIKKGVIYRYEKKYYKYGYIAHCNYNDLKFL